MTISPTTDTQSAADASADSHPNIAHLDCSSGVSGDKFLGALLEAGSMTGEFTASHLADIVASLVPEADLQVRRVDSGGVGATGIRVTNRGDNSNHSYEHAHGAQLGTEHPRGEAAQGHTAHRYNHHDTPPATHHPHRAWSDIRSLIDSCDVLTDRARAHSLLVFGRLAEAEALVHGVEPADVQFHEVGAADSIIDIVGVCAGLDALGIGALYATPPALGSGTVECAHGTLPVPAPATAALLLNFPISASTAVGELTTPTGAALLHLAAGFGPVPPMTPHLLGYGAGTRDIGQPNICRLLVGTPATNANATDFDSAVLLETNIDHITPEAVAFAGEELLAEGALDVWVTPIAMKKGRAALTLSVLVAPIDTERFADRIIALTGTLGVRVVVQDRIIAEREIVTVETEFGEVTVKHGAGRYRPEHEDVARIARSTDLPYHDVLVRILKAIQEQVARS